MVAQLKLESLTDELAHQSRVEKRSARRRQVRLAAKLAFGVTTADCSIRDLSEAGARIHAPSVLGLPDEVWLLIASEGIVVRAERVWARFPFFGLKFIAAEEVERAEGPQAEALRKAWYLDRA